MPSQALKDGILEKLAKRFVRHIAASIALLFLAWQAVFHNNYWSFVARDIFRDDVEKMVIEIFACRNFINDDPEAEQRFSEVWRKETLTYGFGYDDVKFTIEDECPPRTDQEIEASYQYLFDGVDYYSDMDEKAEGKKRIEVEKKMRDYTIKFLNRDFAVFQEDLRNSQ
jgi:hypothetical protein